MPWGVAASVAGTAISAALAPSPSSAGTGAGSNYYDPANMAAANSQWANQNTGSYNTYNQTSPEIAAASAQSFNNGQAANAAYGQAYQQGAGNAGQAYNGLGVNATNAANLDFTGAQGLMAAGQQTYQNALDPNQAQYNLSLNNLTQQTGATNSQYGLGSSGAGAGIQNQALSNFGINWNTQQLQNQIAGLGAYGSAANQAAGLNTNAAALGNTGAQSYLESGQVPYNTAQTIAGQPGQLGSQYATQLNTGVYNPASAQQSLDSNYLSQGNSAIQQSNSAVYGAGNTQANNYATAASNAIGGFGSQSQNLGSYFGGGGSTYGNNYAGTGSPYYSGGGNTYGFTS